MIPRSTLIALAMAASPALADPAEVVAVTLSLTGESWRADVTLSHGDTGWDDYADGWRLELEDGSVLATRVLHHPHVEEQPFTRSLFDLRIPEGADQIYLRTRTSQAGWAETRTTIPVD